MSQKWGLDIGSIWRLTADTSKQKELLRLHSARSGVQDAYVCSMHGVRVRCAVSEASVDTATTKNFRVVPSRVHNIDFTWDNTAAGFDYKAHNRTATSYDSVNIAGFVK